MPKVKRQIQKDDSNYKDLNLNDSYRYEKISGISASISNLALKKRSLCKIRQSGIKVIKPKILTANKNNNKESEESFLDDSDSEVDESKKV